MFGLFKKKEEGPLVTDTIWIGEVHKLKAIRSAWEKDPSTLFVTWFDETATRVKEYVTPGNDLSPIQVISSREATSTHLHGRTVIFLEHYPLYEKEKELFGKMNLTEVHVWSALDEPLFAKFGGEKIINMMRQFGMKEDEPVQHSMISKSIRNAQEKIAAKISIDHSARSQADWLNKSGL